LKTSRTKTAMVKKKQQRKKSQRQPHPGYGLLWIPVFVFFFLLSGLTVFYVWERIALRKMSREIIEYRKAELVLEGENERLKGQLEELCSYRRIYPIATTRFGFVELNPKILFVSAQNK